MRMNRVCKWVGAGVVGLLLVAQLVRPEWNNGEAEGPNSLVKHYDVPPAVRTTLVQACYDCHSNHTVYPWYAKVQPVAWWTSDHVKEGKSELNFSEFGTYSTKRKLKKLDEIVDEVEFEKMPLESYRWIHAEARLSPAEVDQLVAWAEDLAEKIDAP